MTENNVSNNALKPVHIVTGATGAMGSVIARTLAAQGKSVVLACRDLERAQTLADNLSKRTGNPNIMAMHLDLGSFEQVGNFLKEFKAKGLKVAALVNNAGAISPNHQLSPDGYENTIQVNFLSTVMLTLGLAPLIVDDGRVVFITSLTRHFAWLPYEFPAVNNFTSIGTYAQSKLALTLFSIYLSSTMRTRRIAVNCADPGVVDSNILRMNHWYDRLTDNFIRPLASNPENGVRPALRALESADTGFIFKGTSKQIKTATVLKNREVFIKLCNDTMRIVKKALAEQEAQ